MRERETDREKEYCGVEILKYESNLELVHVSSRISYQHLTSAALV